MPGDPSEYRDRAVRYAELAAEATTDQLKARFVELSKIWETLAQELERTEVLLAGLKRQAGEHDPP
jgi:hypothetical protein